MIILLRNYHRENNKIGKLSSYIIAACNLDATKAEKEKLTNINTIKYDIPIDHEI